MGSAAAVAGIVGAFGLAAHVVLLAQTPDVRLTDLTVPADRLPEGCVLPQEKPIEPPGVRRWPSNATNPWTPTEPSDKANVYRMVEGASRVPDGPPMTARDLQRFQSMVVDDIEEAYMATYAGPGETLIRVWALKYKSPPRAIARAHRPYRVAVAYSSGRVGAVVESAQRGSCFEAVNAHVRAMLTR